MSWTRTAAATRRPGTAWVETRGNSQAAVGIFDPRDIRLEFYSLYSHPSSLHTPPHCTPAVTRLLDMHVPSWATAGAQRAAGWRLGSTWCGRSRWAALHAPADRAGSCGGPRTAGPATSDRPRYVETSPHNQIVVCANPRSGRGSSCSHRTKGYDFATASGPGPLETRHVLHCPNGTSPAPPLNARASPGIMPGGQRRNPPGAGSRRSRTGSAASGRAVGDAQAPAEFAPRRFCNGNPRATANWETNHGLRRKIPAARRTPAGRKNHTCRVIQSCILRSSGRAHARRWKAALNVIRAHGRAKSGASGDPETSHRLGRHEAEKYPNALTETPSAWNVH